MDSSTVGPARAWLLLAVVLHGLVYFFLLPPWMGEDEPWHHEYARNLVPAAEAVPDQPSVVLTSSQRAIQERTGALPATVVRTQAEIVRSMGRNRFWQRVGFAGWGRGASNLDHFVEGHTEAHQPPLYYRLLAVGMRLLRIDGVEQQLLFSRGFSFLCYLAVLLFTYLLAGLVARDAWTPTIAVLVAAWLPMHARQAAVVNNDVLVKVFTAAALVLVGKALVVTPPAGPKGQTTAALVGAGALCVVLAFATKPTAIATAVLAGLAVTAIFVRGLGVTRGLAAGAIGGIALTAGALLYWRTIGSHMALPDFAEIRHGLGWALTGDFWRETSRTFLGSFNWESRNLPGPVYLAATILLGTGLLGSLVAVVRRSADLRRPMIALCAGAVVLQLATMMLRGYAAGRYLFPVLPALATLVAVGWIVPLAPRRRALSATALTVALVIYDGIAVWYGLFPNQYLTWSS